MSDTLFELTAVTPQHWSLDVATGLTVGPPDRRFLFGGVGLAAGIHALQRATGRRALCATAQFVSFARIGERLDLSVEVLAGGNAITQAQAVARVGERHVLTVVAALGSRDDTYDGQWLRAPAVPPPDECPHAAAPRLSDALHARFEVRVAEGRYGWSQSEGGAGQERVLFWVRSRDGFGVDAALLAVIADFVAVGIGPAIGLRAGRQQPRQHDPLCRCAASRMGAVRRADREHRRGHRPRHDAHVRARRSAAGNSGAIDDIAHPSDASETPAVRPQP